MVPNSSTCTMALNSLKVWSWGIQEVPSPCQATEIPVLLAERHLISRQGWQCHLYLQCWQLPGSSCVPEVTLSGYLRLFDPSQKSHNRTRAGAVCWQPTHSPRVHNKNHQWRQHVTHLSPNKPSLWPQEDYKGEQIIIHFSTIYKQVCLRYHITVHEGKIFHCPVLQK